MEEERRPVSKVGVFLLILSLLCFAGGIVCLLFLSETFYAICCFAVHAVLDIIVMKVLSSDDDEEEDIDEIMERCQAENELKAKAAALDDERRKLEQAKADLIAQRDDARNQLDGKNIENETLSSELKIAEDTLNDVRSKLTKQIESNSDLKTELQKNSSILPPAKGDIEILNIADVAQEAVNELSGAAAKAGMEIRFNPMNETILVKAEYDRIRILFRNIIDNSIKYMGKNGQLIITISTIEDIVFIVLKDNGNGLDQEEVGHVFELNYQGSNRISGNGLGLTQAKAIVDYYGGNIYARSSKNSGMGIYIQLPSK